MKLFSEETQAALESGDNLVSGAIQIECTPEFAVFGGYGSLPIEGTTYAGIGDRGLVQEVGQSVGGASQAIQAQLSGVEPAAVDLLDANAAQGAAATLRRLIFNGAGTTLLDASVYARGKVDQLLVEETAGAAATLTAMIETAARALARKGSRMRTDADQRLIKATDGGFKAVSYAAQKTLYWGGKRPATVSQAIGGSGRSGGSAYRTQIQ